MVRGMDCDCSLRRLIVAAVEGGEGIDALRLLLQCGAGVLECKDAGYGLFRKGVDVGGCYGAGNRGGGLPRLALPGGGFHGEGGDGGDYGYGAHGAAVLDPVVSAAGDGHHAVGAGLRIRLDGAAGELGLQLLKEAAADQPAAGADLYVEVGLRKLQLLAVELGYAGLQLEEDGEGEDGVSDLYVGDRVGDLIVAGLRSGELNAVSPELDAGGLLLPVVRADLAVLIVRCKQGGDVLPCGVCLHPVGDGDLTAVPGGQVAKSGCGDRGGGVLLAGEGAGLETEGKLDLSGLNGEHGGRLGGAVEECAVHGCPDVIGAGLRGRVLGPFLRALAGVLHGDGGVAQGFKGHRLRLSAVYRIQVGGGGDLQLGVLPPCGAGAGDGGGEEDLAFYGLIAVLVPGCKHEGIGLAAVSSGLRVLPLQAAGDRLPGVGVAEGPGEGGPGERLSGTDFGGADLPLRSGSVYGDGQVRRTGDKVVPPGAGQALGVGAHRCGGREAGLTWGDPQLFQADGAGGLPSCEETAEDLGGAQGLPELLGEAEGVLVQSHFPGAHGDLQPHVPADAAVLVHEEEDVRVLAALQVLFGGDGDGLFAVPGVQGDDGF